MKHSQSSNKIHPQHLSRKAVVYMRQSSDRQVRENLESQRLQRELQVLARELGWCNVEVLDGDLGSSASLGARKREDFDRLVGSVTAGVSGYAEARRGGLLDGASLFPEPIHEKSDRPL